MSPIKRSMSTPSEPFLLPSFPPLPRNYAYGPDQEPKHSGSFRVMVRDALRATTAAPTFFSPLEKDDAKYCDGAFLANNPTGARIRSPLLLPLLPSFYTHQLIIFLSRPLPQPLLSTRSGLFIQVCLLSVWFRLARACMSTNGSPTVGMAGRGL